MKSKQEAYVKEEITSSLKLTKEEILAVGGFDHLSSDELEQLSEFILTISEILYQSFSNERA